MFSLPRMVLILLFFSIVCLVPRALAHGAAGSALEERIHFYSHQLEENPTLWGGRLELAAAYLERARARHDPRDLERARAAVELSLATQPSARGFKLAAAAANFAHRFDEGRSWALRARAAAPEDAEAGAILAEAFLGLGRYRQVEALLPFAGDAPLPRFYTAAVRGRWQAELGEFDAAVEAFRAAAAIAGREGLPKLLQWAEVRTAESLLAAGRRPSAVEARNRARGAAAEPAVPSAEVRLLDARLLEAADRREEALAVYQELLLQGGDPELHRQAHRLARGLGRQTTAEHHFRAAEAAYLEPMAAGEVYSLEGLAGLYCEAGRHLERARELAEENLRFKKDASARRVVACLRD